MHAVLSCSHTVMQSTGLPGTVSYACTIKYNIQVTNARKNENYLFSLKQVINNHAFLVQQADFGVYLGKN